MNTDLHYNGYSARPSDYESPDGDLSMSLNLIKEDSHLRPLMPPAEVLSLQPGEKVLYTHHVPGQTNYILSRPASDGSLSLLWMVKTTGAVNTSSATTIKTLPQLNDIEAVGNTLILALDDDLYYLLWRDNSYVDLGSRPPFVSVDTAMTKISTATQTLTSLAPMNWLAGSGVYGTSARRPDDDSSDTAALTQSVFALVNSTVAEQVAGNGFFHQPFLLRYAFRLFDGSYAWHSAPVLQLPTVLPPIVSVTDNGKADDVYSNVTLSLSLPVFRLDYRILTDCAEKLALWKDVIAGIDFFVTSPIYTYDQSKDVGRPTRLRTYLMTVTGCLSGDRPGANTNPGNTVTRPSRGTSLTTDIFIGHYADADEDPGNFVDRYQSLDVTSTVCINIPVHEKMADNVRSAHLFYKVAEVPLSDITSMSSMAPLPIQMRDLTSLVTFPTLPDDYQSHFKKGTTNLYAFNSRLNLGGVSLTPPEPFPIRSVMQFGNPGSSSASGIKIRVWTRHNGTSCVSTHYGSASDIADLWYKPSGNFPRYIFYPDSTAYKMQFELSATEKITIDLTPHDFMNGAYYFNPDFQLDTLPSGATPETALCALSVPMRSKIYTSEVNNPFQFPVLGINTVGTGDILSIRSAVKALSQGQFGQFPLYAFTSEGVWALQTNSSGTYSAIQPVTRDICNNPAGVTQIDTAVLFPSDRGVMLISGSEAVCISDTINTEYPFLLPSLPSLTDIHSSMGGAHLSDNCISIPPFSAFISGCKMIYDYTHQHIIIFNPAHSFAFVYSLTSKQWGMIHSKITDRVNAYPNALAIDSDHKLVDFSIDNDTDIVALLVTRPVKLQPADTLKTVSNVIQRGHFVKGHVKSLLYGSRDLADWCLIWSSKDHFLRGFSGTPYKYYRIALLCSLSPRESINGASIQYAPRFTAQPR